MRHGYRGTDTLGVPSRKRIPTDDSIQVKYCDRPDRNLHAPRLRNNFRTGIIGSPEATPKTMEAVNSMQISLRLINLYAESLDFLL